MKSLLFRKEIVYQAVRRLPGDESNRFFKRNDRLVTFSWPIAWSHTIPFFKREWIRRVKEIIKKVNTRRITNILF
jgi:hypothetical protein